MLRDRSNRNNELDFQNEWPSRSGVKAKSILKIACLRKYNVIKSSSFVMPCFKSSFSDFRFIERKFNANVTNAHSGCVSNSIFIKIFLLDRYKVHLNITADTIIFYIILSS